MSQNKRPIDSKVIRVAFGPGGGRIADAPDVEPEDLTPLPEPSHREPLADVYTQTEVTRLLGLSGGKLRSLDRAGIGSPTGRRKGRRAYTFSDLIALLQDAPSWRFAEFQCLLLISGIAVVWLVPLGALILSPRRRRLRPLLQTTWLTLAVAVASLTLWCLLMFSGGSTIPHQGSIILIFLPTLLCALLVSALSLRIGIVVLIVQAAAFAYLMIPPNRVRFDAIPAYYAPSPVALLVLALGIACGLAGLVAASVADRKGR